MFRLRVEIAGEVQMDRGIARFADGVADYRPIWPLVVEEFHAQVKSQFLSEGVEGGARWQALTPAYAGWKAEHFPGTRILERTGNLMRSLTTSTDPNAVVVEERKTLTLGSRVPYALYHQTGTRRMAQRKEIMLTEAFKRQSMHHVQTYLVQIANAVGLRSRGGSLQAGSAENWRRAMGLGWL